jgi:hypothetical protein
MPDNVRTGCKGCAHNARMRGAYDACAHKVRALALQGAPLGAANVRSPVRCAFVRCNTHGGLAPSQDQLSS